MDDTKLYELLEDVLIEPDSPAPPGVEERYQEMIRTQFARPSVQLPSWRSLGWLVACVSMVLVLWGLAQTLTFSPVFALIAVLCSWSYAAFLRAAAGWTQAPTPA